MKKQSEGKKRVILMGFVTILVFLGFILWAVPTMIKGKPIHGIGIIIVALVLLVFAVFQFKRMYYDVKKGYPLRDERSNKVLMVAFAKAFIFSIWWLLILSWLSEDLIKFRDASQALGVGILGMAIIFGLSWLYFNSKEDIDKVWA